MKKMQTQVTVLAVGLYMAHACSSDHDCSLNGECTSVGTCECDAPWSGDRCGVLRYANHGTPAAQKDAGICPTIAPRNTWNGPIIRDHVTGLYHIFDPVYPEQRLGGSTSILRGTARSPTGPWTWGELPDLHGGKNPAMVVYPDARTGKPMYSLWTGSLIQVADSLDGNATWTKLTHKSPGGANPAVIWHAAHGAFYLTSQHTTTVWTTKALDEPWTVYASIDPPEPSDKHREDPFMYIDHRGNWHIIGHSYDTTQSTACGTSTLSNHLFSADGKNWAFSADEPYGHVVTFDDGSTHTYTTLERPNMVFDSQGRPTHLNVAADLVTQDMGCGNRTQCHEHPCSCTNCKYLDLAGTLVITLDTPSE